MPNLSSKNRGEAHFYAHAALEASGVAAAVADAEGQLVWSTPPFDRLALELNARSGQALLSLILAAQPLDQDDQRGGSHVSIIASGIDAVIHDLPGADEQLIILETSSTSEPTDDDDAHETATVTLDAVTGLPDRAMLESHLRRRFESPAPFALLFIDIDGFKQVNDSLGHLAGDKVLRELAMRICQALREHDFVARFGGDEFLAVIEGIERPDALKPVLERLRATVGAPLVVQDHERFVSASIGSALSIDDYSSYEAMLHAADQRMYATRSSRASR